MRNPALGSRAVLLLLAVLQDILWQSVGAATGAAAAAATAAGAAGSSRKLAAARSGPPVRKLYWRVTAQVLAPDCFERPVFVVNGELSPLLEVTQGDLLEVRGAGRAGKFGRAWRGASRRMHPYGRRACLPGCLPEAVVTPAVLTPCPQSPLSCRYPLAPLPPSPRLAAHRQERPAAGASEGAARHLDPLPRPQDEGRALVSDCVRDATTLLPPAAAASTCLKACSTAPGACHCRHPPPGMTAWHLSSPARLLRAPSSRTALWWTSCQVGGCVQGGRGRGGEGKCVECVERVRWGGLLHAVASGFVLGSLPVLSETRA